VSVRARRVRLPPGAYARPDLPSTPVRPRPPGRAGDLEGGVRDVVESVDDEVSAPEAHLREGFGLVDVAVE
jgi:hypothetical protein